MIVFDTRGSGRTDKPDIPYSIEMMVEDTINLLDLLGIKRTHFIASSMGSRIALVLAAKYPERVKSLVLHVAFHRVPFPRSVIWGLMWRIPGGKKQMRKGAEFLFK